MLHLQVPTQGGNFMLRGLLIGALLTACIRPGIGEAREKKDAPPDLSELTNARAQLAGKKTRKQGMRTLMRLSKSRRPVVAALAVAALAERFCRDKTEGEKPTRILGPYADCTTENLRFPRISAFAGALRYQAVTGQMGQALHRLKMADVRVEDGLSQVIIHETYGDLQVRQNQLQPARERYRRALADGAAYFKRRNISETASKVVLEPAKPWARYWPPVRVRIEQKLKKVERDIRILAFGLDYVLYEEARKFQTQGNTEDAQKRYGTLIELFPKSIYAEAARFYRCQLHCGEDWKCAKTRLRAFINKKPDGLYRGAALLCLADIALTRDWDAAGAEKLYRETVAWCQGIRREDRAVRLYAVPEKSREISTPAAEFQRIDEWGIIHKIPVPPNKLLNRLTAKWYLNNLEKQCRYGLIFCFMSGGKWTEARLQVSRLLDLDPAMRKVNDRKLYTTYFRFKTCCDLKRIRRAEPFLKPFPPNQRLKLQFADFRFLDRDFSGAARLFRELLTELEGKRGEKARAARSVLLCGLGSVAYMQFNPKQVTRSFDRAVKFYEQAYAEHPQGVFGAQSAFYLGVRYSYWPGRKDTRALWEKALVMFKRAERQFLAASLPLQAQESIAPRIPALLQLGRRKEALALAKKLLARNPAYQQSVDSWLQLFSRK